MPVISKDAVLSIEKPDDVNFTNTYFYDPTGTINKDNGSIMYGYKDSAFAAPTLRLDKTTEYSPTTIASFNSGATALEIAKGKGYKGQDFIISIYRLLGKNSMSAFYFEVNHFKEKYANKVTYYYVEMGTSANEQSQGWESSDRGWKYKEANGNYISNTWKQLDGIWYSFDGEGYIVTSWRQIDGAWYFFSGNGAMLTGWIQSGNDWYYMSPSGAMLTGWVQSGNDWYYMSPSGAMLSNTTTSDGYVLDGSGRWIR